MERLQRKGTLDEKRVKNPLEGEEAPQGQKIYNNGHNLKRCGLAVVSNSNYHSKLPNWAEVIADVVLNRLESKSLMFRDSIGSSTNSLPHSKFKFAV